MYFSQGWTGGQDGVSQDELRQNASFAAKSSRKGKLMQSMSLTMLFILLLYPEPEFPCFLLQYILKYAPFTRDLPLQVIALPKGNQSLFVNPFPQLSSNLEDFQDVLVNPKNSVITYYSKRLLQLIVQMRKVIPFAMVILILVRMSSATLGMNDGELCDPTCDTCYYGLDPRFCATCGSTRQAVPVYSSYVQCNCIAGTFESINSVCATCQSQCTTCQGSASNCTACNGSNRNPAPSCSCLNGYYNNSGSCSACHFSCSTCQTSSTCSTCNADAFREFDGANCNCMWGYYDNSVATCALCPYSCVTCTNSTVCTLCQFSNHRDLKNDACLCMEGYYDDGVNSYCPFCHYSCLTCTGPSNTNCTSCHPAYRTFNATTGTCDCLNPASTYEVSGNMNCGICMSECASCNSSSTCTSCSADKFRVLNNQTFGCDCMVGYYRVPGGQDTPEYCGKCMNSCLTCANSYSCLSCDVSLNRILAGSPSLCDCKTGYMVSGDVCVVACQVSCLTCVASYTDRCATCESSTKRVYNGTNQQCECPSGYADDGLTAACIACSYTCITCSKSATNCTSCPATRTFNAGSNTCPCNTKLYDAGNATCLSCMITCKTCTSGTTCSSCEASAFRSLSASQCVCMTGYFDNGQNETCLACNYRCATCSSSTTCNTCAQFSSRTNPALNCPCSAPFYDNGVPICVRCHYTCATCSNGSQCLTCSNSTYRSLNNATKLCTCISGYYDPGYDSDISTPQACLPCKAGCAVCTTSSNCQQCTNTSYYVNSTTFACSLCSSACLTCSGPASNNCLSCVFPKYVVAQMCVDVVCPFGKYVDLMGGCSACSELYENSLSCTIDEPLSCTAASKLSEQECKTCNQVTGYALSDGECKEICGDGFLIGYQCDDGNTLNGDGCSSSCSIEEGWSCSVVSNRSSCTLTAAVELTLLRMVKLPRKNVIRVTLQISLPLRLSSSNFAVSFSSLSASDFTTTILPQGQSELRSISFEIQYRASLQNQRLTLSYSQSRRLQEAYGQQRGSFGAPRLLPSVSFSANLEVTTFPPANYIAADSYGFYDRASAAIFVLSLVLLFLSLIIAPKKHALHSVSLAWLVPYLYFTVFYATGYTTDWLSPMASNLKYVALFFGFSFGPCCSSDSLLGTTSEVVSNAGAVIVVLLAFWLAYLVLFLFTLKNKAEILAKALRMTKYLLVTLHAFFFFGLIFASLNAFTKYVNSNKVDGANLFVALAVLIVTCCFLLYLWFATCTKFQANLKSASEKGSKEPSERKAFADVQPNQPNLEHDESNIVIKMSNAKNEISVVAASIHALSVPETAVEEAAEEEPFLLYDFCSLYSAHRLAKYFLPALLSKLFLFAIFSATLTANPFAMLLLHLLLSTAFLAFLIAVRPFESKLTQAKLIVIEVLLIALQLPFAIYQFYGLQSVYLQSVESYLIVEIIFLLLAAVCFAFAEQAVVWKALLAELCGSLGVEGMSRKVKDIPAPAVEEKRETIRIEEALERPLPKEEEVEEKPQSQPQFKETDMVRFTHSAALPRRRERTRTAAEKTSQEQFA